MISSFINTTSTRRLNDESVISFSVHFVDDFILPATLKIGFISLKAPKTSSPIEMLAAPVCLDDY